MPLQKIQLKPGIDREATYYASEGGWYDADKVRFRHGFPEKIGGWVRRSNTTYEGICRGLFEWLTLGGASYTAVGTHTHLYIYYGGGYYDITPIMSTTDPAGADPIETVSGSSIVTVTDATKYSQTEVGDRVVITGVTAVNGITLDGEYTVVGSVTSTTFQVDAGTNASGSGTGGGSTVKIEYVLPIGREIAETLSGWGAGAWSEDAWGQTSFDEGDIRLWSFSKFGEDLVASVYDGGVFYFDVSNGLSTRAILLSELAVAQGIDPTDAVNYTPTYAHRILVSDNSRFLLAFGTNDLAAPYADDELLIRWTDQESAVDWFPSSLNQAGSVRLSVGSEIVTAVQSRQEILVWTDAAVYSMQYVGPPVVWAIQFISAASSIASPNAVAYVNGMTFWMGQGKFFAYDGVVRPMQSKVRKYVFDDFNNAQRAQVFAAVNEEFNEVWWFYPSANSTTIDKYVIYNYVDGSWSIGNMARTAWVGETTNGKPVAATYSNRLVDHEVGLDDLETPILAPITAHITSAQFDIEDGHRFAFVSRIMPDIRFDGSTTANPSATMTLIPLKNSGSGYTSPTSESSVNGGAVTRSATVPIEQYTEQINVRVRGRQMVFQITSDGEGVQWQVGIPRIDMRTDGQR